MCCITMLLMDKIENYTILTEYTINMLLYNNNIYIYICYIMLLAMMIRYYIYYIVTLYVYYFITMLSMGKWY